MFWKKVKSKFWSFVWFFLIPAAISAFVEFMLVRSDVFIEIAPWRLLLILAIAAFALLSFKNYLPFWHDDDLEAIAIKKKIKKEAATLVKQLASYKQKREKKGLDNGTTSRISKHLGYINKALEENDYRKIRDAIEKSRDAKLPRGALPSSNSAVELIKIFGTAIVLAILLRSFVVEPFKIPSASMIPTLQIGDHIFVSKFTYGIKMPCFFKKHYFWKVPSRGDVIVFKPPHDPEKDFIKRVVGRAGDVLELRDSVLYVNKIPIPRCEIGWVEYEDRDQETAAWRKRKGVLFLEKMGDVNYLVMNSPYTYSWGPTVVDEGTLYVFGDNRDSSFDSRAWGGVPFDNIKGEGMIIWWSNGPGPSLRLGRMGHRICGLPYINSKLKEPIRECIDKLETAKTISN